MANLRDLNSPSNPILDFINALATQGQEHPFFAAFNPEARERGPPPPESNAPPPEGADHEGSASGPSPPPSNEGPPQPPPAGHGPGPYHQGPHHGPPPHEDDPFSGHGFPFGGPFGGRGRHHGPPHGRHGGWGGRGGGWGGRGGGGGRHCGSGPRGFGSPFEEQSWGGPGGFDMSKLGEFLAQFAPGVGFDNASSTTANNNANSNNNNKGAESKDFHPPIDIFDTPTTYLVHVSLPGAKKEDVGVSWDADKSELHIAGVVHRPADEETMKTLALDEREVGAFERTVALGSKREPAGVDGEGIAARMEDGVLVVTIPKLEQGFVEVKKVDIE